MLTATFGSSSVAVMLSEKIIQCALWAQFAHRSLALMPNFTPQQWWECDVWSCSPSMITTEFEIKISRADFKADTKKSDEQFRRDAKGAIVRDAKGWPVVERRNKHELLAQGSTSGPNRFYYVLPRGLVGLDDVPSWAGLIWFNPEAPLYRATTVLKNAPRLHGKKASESLVLSVYKTAYWRFMRRLEREALELAGKKC